MTHTDEDELKALRRRAYGRDSDIHLDPDSLERLRELENVRVAAAPDAVHDEVEVGLLTADPPMRGAPPQEEVPRPTPRWILWLASLRRSTVLIVIGVVAIVATLATALVLVQRVQTDPLQTGANQVARLPVDEGFEVPSFFAGNGSRKEDDPRAFQAFHGLRAVTTTSSIVFGSSPGSTCLVIYSEAAVTYTADSFGGPMFGGCAAGKFPPIVQFSVALDELPPELQSAFPKSTSLQFVYDRQHKEVVVFADR